MMMMPLRQSGAVALLWRRQLGHHHHSCSSRFRRCCWLSSNSRRRIHYYYYLTNTTTATTTNTTASIRATSLSSSSSSSQHQEANASASAFTSSSSSSTSKRLPLRTVLQQQIQRGYLEEDAAQQEAARHLQRLQKALSGGYSNHVTLTNLMNRRRRQQQQQVLLQEGEKEERRQQQQQQVKLTKQARNTELPQTGDDDDNNNNNPKQRTEETTQQQQKNSATIAMHNDDNGTSPHCASSLLVPRGLYLHGSVGTGKSMLLDAFYDVADVPKKRRCHLHAFMNEIHVRMHQVRLDQQRQRHKQREREREKQEQEQNEENLNRKKADDNDSSNHMRSKPMEQQQQQQQDLALEGANPVQRVGLQLASEVSLLCFDEFHVTDVADALLLSQLFAVLLAAGTVVVATSNASPTMLANDLARNNSAAATHLHNFGQLLERHCVVHKLNSNTDYRVSRAALREEEEEEEKENVATMEEEDSRLVFNNDETPQPQKGFAAGNGAVVRTTIGTDHNNAAVETLDALLPRFNDNDRDRTTTTLDLGFGRQPWMVPTMTTLRNNSNNHNVARLTFSQLEEGHLGASDYRKLAHRFAAVVLEDIPRLSAWPQDPKGADRTQRFVTFLDELYEAKVALACTALDAPHPLQIFCREKPEDGATLHGGADDETGLRTDATTTTTTTTTPIRDDDDEEDNQDDNDQMPLACQRATSRLVEMTSKRWWDQAFAMRSDEATE